MRLPSGFGPGRLGVSGAGDEDHRQLPHAAGSRLAQTNVNVDRLLSADLPQDVARQKRSSFGTEAQQPHLARERGQPAANSSALLWPAATIPPRPSRPCRPGAWSAGGGRWWWSASTGRNVNYEQSLYQAASRPWKYGQTRPSPSSGVAPIRRTPAQVALNGTSPTNADRWCVRC